MAAGALCRRVVALAGPSSSPVRALPCLHRLTPSPLLSARALFASFSADELGMFIELEMPLVWASDNVGGAAFNYTVQAQREAMVFNRNHPSVIFWSLGNESPWNSNFKNSLAGFLREIDTTRLFMFDGGSGQAVPPLDLLTVHYPDFAAAESFANAVNPTLFGEYAHLNCYNRREIATDQGVRDIWGLGIETMWEIVYAAEGVLGACYWAGEKRTQEGWGRPLAE